MTPRRPGLGNVRFSSISKLQARDDALGHPGCVLESCCWNSSSGVMAACGAARPWLCPRSSRGTVGLVLQVCPSRRSARSTCSFSWPVSSGTRDPSFRKRARPCSRVGKGCLAPGSDFARRHRDICPRLSQGCTVQSQQAKHHSSLSSPEHG